MASVRKAGRRRLGAVLAAGGLLGTLLTFSGAGPVQAQSVPDFPGGANFSAHASGNAVFADVLTADVPGPRIVDGEIAFSNAAVNTAGLDAGVENEMQSTIVPKAGAESASVDSAGKEAYGKGSAVEVGLATELGGLDPNQIKLTQTAAGSEPPAVTEGATQVTPGDSASTGLVRQSLADVPASPLLYADLLESQAGAVWSNKTCIVGQPLAVGTATAANAQLVAAGPDDPSDDELEGPLVTTDSTPGDEVVDSQSFTYLIANKNADGTPDGTYGVVSETRMELVPVTLVEDPTTGQGVITIQVAGTWFFRMTATGKGPATYQYGVIPDEDATNDTPILEVLTDGVSQGVLTLGMLLGEQGLEIPASPLAQIAVGEAPRALAEPGDDPDMDSTPTLGVTEASGAVDVVRVILLKPSGPDAGTHLADIRVGHMESKINVPEGGFRCTFPVEKRLSNGGTTVQAGQPFEFTIEIPSDPTALDGLGCDIVAIRAFDELRNNTAGARLTGSTPAGTLASDGQRIDWANLGSYKNGDPPIQVKVTATASRAGSFENFVEAHATLGNCDGGGLLDGEALASFLEGADLVGDGAVVGGAQLQGTGTSGVLGVQVLGQQLPATGGRADTLYIGLAVAALLSAAGVYRLTRKAQPTS